MRWVIAVALVTGCYRDHALENCSIACTVDCPAGFACGADGMCHADGTGDCNTIDPSPDAPPPHDVPPQQGCFGDNTPFQICLVSPPPAVALPATIDTDNSAMCLPPEMYIASDPTPACVIASTAFSIQDLTATGTKPLVLVGYMLTLTGRIEIGNVGSAPSAAGSSGCDLTSAQIGHTDASGGGGGGGGGNAAGGGDGGGGNQGGVPRGGGGPARGAPTMLIGGCPGGPGGIGTVSSTSGAGGAGGGAIALVMHTKLTIAGGAVINAGGGGGAGGDQTGGGGGGGAGGTIILVAPSMTIDGDLAATGGGGGGGSCAAPSTFGMSGGHGDPVGVAGGGVADELATLDGDGGNGAYTAANDRLTGRDGSALCGGGGGGGAGGWIVSYGSSAVTGQIHPLLTLARTR